MSIEPVSPLKFPFRVLAWFLRNVVPGLAISAVAVVVLALVAEAYFHVEQPSFEPKWPVVFEPDVGFRFKPNADVATTNNLDFWTRQQANSLGLLDREPIPPASRSGSCHVVLLGDSFIEAHQVAIERKVQVQLEKLAAERAPDIKLTAAAVGMSDTGQLGQLPLYDRFARPQKPKILVLVFVKNDFGDNSALLQSVARGLDPRHLPRLSGRRSDAGSLELQPIDADWTQFALPRFQPPPPNWLRAELLRHSRLYRWVEENAWRAALFFGRYFYGPTAAAYDSDAIVHYARTLAQRPEYARVLADWDAKAMPAVDEVFFEEQLPSAFREALEITGFALDQYQERARRDGFRLLILATQTMKREGGQNLAFDRLSHLAAARGIPLIDLFAEIQRRGGRVADARFRYDGHWSPQGHRWAAEALLDHIMQHPGLCR